MPTTWSNC